MMVHEVIHSLEVGKREGQLLKLDLSKAYDQVDWTFLGSILQLLALIKRYASLSLNLFLLHRLPLWSMGLPLTSSNLQED